MALPVPAATIPEWPDTTNTHDAALAYHNAGLCVIPLSGKRPALGGWKHYQTQRPTEADIRRWQREGLLQNLGIVCGAVSGNLVVFDFDGPGAYSAFAALFPALAQSCTVATGSGQGKHVYLHADALPPTTRALDTPIGHIELQAEGCYVAAPPSIHPVTNRQYTVEKPVDILRVPDLDELVRWIESFKPRWQDTDWRPPQHLPPTNGTVNPDLIAAIADVLRQRRHRERGKWINCSCPNATGHKNGDRHPSFGFNLESGYGYCYVCGSMLAKDLCDLLGIDPRDHGGLLRKSEPPVIVNRPVEPAAQPAPPPPPDDLPPLVDITLPGWLQEYVGWASRVGNQTPVSFHLSTGIWMAAVAIARRVYADARWGVRVFPNLYMMFIADTTFYRKTTAYKLGECILTSAIPHMLMPTPGSPERFQGALSGKLPGKTSAS